MNHEDDDPDDMSREFCFILATLPITGKQCQCPECKPTQEIAPCSS